MLSLCGGIDAVGVQLRVLELGVMFVERPLCKLSLRIANMGGLESTFFNLTHVVERWTVLMSKEGK